MDIRTEVTKVRMYFQGAELCRQGRAELEEGINHLRVFGMRSFTDKETLRIRFPQRVTAKGIRISENDPEPENGDLQKLRQQADELEERIGLLRQQYEQWRALGDCTNNTKADLQQLTEYTEKLPDRLFRTYEAIEALKKDGEKISEKIVEAEAEMEAPVIELTVSAETAGECPFEIEYYDQMAGWKPMYEFHSPGLGEPVDVVLKAAAFQTTGEDWKDVELSFCTGAAFKGNREPKLVPYRVGLRNPGERTRPPGPMAAAPSSRWTVGLEDSADAAYSMAPLFEKEEALVEDLAPLQGQAAGIEIDEARTEYTVAEKKTVPSGDSGMVEEISNTAVPAEYRTKMIPVMDENAYMSAIIKGADMARMHTGEASVFYKGAYVGSARIEPEFPEDQYVIPLGPAEGIRGWREETKSIDSKKGILKNANRMEREFEIHIVSDMKAELEVEDQIPVTSHKDLNIELHDPDHAEAEASTGILKWKVSVEPGEQKILRFGYEMSWPKDCKLKVKPSW